MPTVPLDYEPLSEPDKLLLLELVRRALEQYLDDKEHEDVVFSYTVSDPEGLTDEAEVTIRIHGVNDAPTLDEVEDIEAEEGDTVELELSATDPEDDELTFSLGEDAPEGATITDGNVVVWEAGEAGEYTFTVEVTDDGGRSDTGEVTIFVAEVNHAPELEEIEDLWLASGDTVEFTVEAWDEDEGQELTFSLGEGAPEGAEISEDGEFSWDAPEVEGEEEFSITVIVTDDGEPELSDSQEFSILVEWYDDEPDPCEYEWECCEFDPYFDPYYDPYFDPYFEDECWWWWY